MGDGGCSDKSITCLSTKYVSSLLVVGCSVRYVSNMRYDHPCKFPPLDVLLPVMTKHHMAQIYKAVIAQQSHIAMAKQGLASFAIP